MTHKFTPPIVSPDCYPKGFRGAGMTCGIKKSGKPDLALIVSDKPAAGAGVFTLNAFAAAPVQVTRESLKNGELRAIVCNSGNANACTGAQGLADARAMQVQAARELSLEPHQVAVCSTGIIGQPLPMALIQNGIHEIAPKLRADHWDEVVDAMRTTDAFPKMQGAKLTLAGGEVRLLGLAKGGGMIHPNMATMLAFLLTDAAIRPAALQAAMTAAADNSFNMISVDGDSSTNDTALIMANGAAGNAELKLSGEDFEKFRNALSALCLDLAKQICHDGEGATRVGIITVSGAKSDADARLAARAVGKSILVKTALYGADANWGRILCAVGYSGAQVDPEKCSVALGGLKIFDQGKPLGVDEARAQARLEKLEVPIAIDLGLGGPGRATFITSDLTHDYIQLNAFYRT